MYARPLLCLRRPRPLSESGVKPRPLPASKLRLLAASVTLLHERWTDGVLELSRASHEVGAVRLLGELPSNLPTVAGGAMKFFFNVLCADWDVESLLFELMEDDRGTAPPPKLTFELEAEMGRPLLLL